MKVADDKNRNVYESRRWRLLKFLLHDFGRKLVALVLAALLYWTINQKLQNKEKIPNVKVELSLPSDIYCSNPIPEKVILTLGGKQHRLQNMSITALRVQAKVNLSELMPGEPCKVRLRARDVLGLESGIRVLDIEPRDVEINWEPRISQSVSVRMLYDSEKLLAEDYLIDKEKSRSVPSEVTVNGPKSILASMKEIDTLPIPIDGQTTENFSYSVGLNLPKNVSCDVHQVEAQIEIVKTPSDRMFPKVALLTVQSPEHTRKFKVTKIEPESVMVTLGGPKGLVNQVRKESIRAYLNIDGITMPGKFFIGVTTALEGVPEGVTVKRIHPATAEVTVERE